MPSPDSAAVAIRGSRWRHVPLGGDPWHRPVAPASNRWQRGDVVAAMYLADSAETAWAEWYRHLAERALPPMQTLPRDLWRRNVDLERVADLRAPEALAAQELSPPRPTRVAWPPFQRVGEALHEAGWPALVAASAARPSGSVLCVFRPGTAQPAGIEPVPPPARADEPPAPPRGMTT
jgi:RES domain-containing protein